MARIYSESEVLADIRRNLDLDSLEQDNSHQLLLYTGFYRWEDGTIRDEGEPGVNTSPLAFEPLGEGFDANGRPSD